jgi:hypothetical protein
MLHIGAVGGHLPASLHGDTQRWLVGSQTWSCGQSPSTPQGTQSWSAESQRGKPGAVHWLSSTQGTHSPEVVSQ